MIWGGIWLMCELQWNRALLTMATFEPQEDILNNHGEKIGQSEKKTMHIHYPMHDIYVITEIALVRQCNDTWLGFDQLVSHFCWSYNSNFCHNISKLFLQQQRKTLLAWNRWRKEYSLKIQKNLNCQMLFCAFSHSLEHDKHVIIPM